MKRAALAVLLFCFARPGMAVTPVDFYLDLLSKGVAEFNDAQYKDAAELLRVAAFGLLDATSHYQTAQVYRALAADRLKDTDASRDAVRRVLAAERVQRTYTSLELPAAVRTSFETLAKKSLSASEMRLLTSPQPINQATEQPKQEPKQEAKKPAPQPKPETTKPETTKPETTKPETPKPEPKKAEPPKTEPPKTEPPKTNVAQSLTTAERALAAGNLGEARRVYRTLLDSTLTHEQAIRVGEGLYRARDFANVLRAFERAGTLRKGEEPYHFYIAVAYYETGRFAAAKKELATALEHIEITPDVTRYRQKIESAAD